MTLYSIKMRASAKGQHISGAERIVPPEFVPACTDQLVTRGMTHPKGVPDEIHVRLTQLSESDVLELDALPVTTVEVDSCRDGLDEMRRFLLDMGICRADEIVTMLVEAEPMRGAMLVDADTLERLEPDLARGVRATYMDAERPNAPSGASKNHFAEAIVLATKVAHAPGIIAELCISDDPDYVTGYAASFDKGYVRISKLKPSGSARGGRIFLYRGDRGAVGDTILYLEKQPVVVRGITLPDNRCEDKFAFITDTLEDMRSRSLLRSLRTIESGQSAVVRYRGRDTVMLASNDYLDLSVMPEVKERAQAALLKYGTGSGGSRLTTGNTDLHESLENKIASFKGTESALVFNTGYVANLATISALMGKKDVIFSDELNHASIIDGCRLSGAKIVIYRHNDMEDLERRVRENPTAKGLIVSDAVFSMDGDILDLPRFTEIADRYGLISMIDEAHSTGVIGRTGRGICEYYGNSYMPDIIMGTLSKAAGSEGGFICGSQKLTDYLMNRARGFIFSTSLSSATTAASLGALEYIDAHPERIAALKENVDWFCECLRSNGVRADSGTAIVPIHIGDEQRAVRASEKLMDLGFFIPAIRYPTVPRGSARLRAALMATHTREQLLRAANAIADVLRQNT